MRFFDRIDREALVAVKARDEYIWLDLTYPGEEEITGLKEFFGRISLALEGTFERCPCLNPVEAGVFCSGDRQPGAVCAGSAGLVAASDCI